MIFDNLPGGTNPIASDVYLRSAANVGGAAMGLIYQIAAPLAPAAPTPFFKTDQYFLELTNFVFRVKAQKTNGVVLARSGWVETPFVTAATDTYGNTRHELILVGTKVKNARFVVINRPAP